MALSVGVNSYVTVEQADDVLLNRLDVAAWINASPEEKEKSLITATAYLEGKKWIGQTVSSSQSLAWPRTNASYFDPRVGTIVNLDNTVPKRVINATIELAYHMLNNDGLLDSGMSAKSITIGPISIGDIRASSKDSLLATDLITPLLSSNTNNWWRAN